MSALRRDLIEKRLWPLVVVIILAIAAVPFLLARRSQASVTVIPAVPSPATASAKPATTRSGGKPVSVSEERRELHRLSHKEISREATRNPFLVAPAWTGAKKTTSGATATTTTVAAASPVSTSPASTGTASSTTSGPTSIGGGSTVTSEGPPAGTPGQSAPTSTVTQTVTETATAPTQTSTTTATTVADGPVGNGPWTMYSVDVSSAKFNFATHKLGPVTTHHDLVRLSPLPSVTTPKVMFTGVTDHGHEAVFALGAGVEAKGKGRCLPDANVCSAIAVPLRGVETLTWYDSDGSPDERALQVSKLLGTTTDDRARAAAAFARHSRAGQCELDLSEPLQYDDTSGSVSSASSDDCSKVKGAAPFPGTRSGS